MRGIGGGCEVAAVRACPYPAAVRDAIESAYSGGALALVLVQFFVAVTLAVVGCGLLREVGVFAADLAHIGHRLRGIGVVVGVVHTVRLPPASLAFDSFASFLVVADHTLRFKAALLVVLIPISLRPRYRTPTPQLRALRRVTQRLPIRPFSPKYGGFVVVPVAALPVESPVFGVEEEPEAYDDHEAAEGSEEGEEGLVVEGCGGLSAGARVECACGEGGALCEEGEEGGRCHCGGAGRSRGAVVEGDQSVCCDVVIEASDCC